MILKSICLTFLLAVGGSADLHKKVRHFETLRSEDLHVATRSKRSADGRNTHTKHISFRTLGRDFKLVLTPGSPVLGPNFVAKTVDQDGKTEPFYVNPNNFFSGHLADDPSVTVDAHYEDGVLSSNINFQHDTYVVEPAWRHKDPSENFTMISYKGSDINWNEILPIDPKTGKRVKMRDGIKLPDVASNNTGQADSHNTGGSRQKRAAVQKNTCPLLVVADFHFFRDVGSYMRSTTAAFIISAIQNVNVHFKRTAFDEGNGYVNMGFQIDEMKIHVKFTNTPNHYNSDKNWNYNEKLFAFSRSPTVERFCLGHLFTSYPMKDNVLGLAFIAPESVASAGGICSIDTDLEGSRAYPRTGWSSAKNARGHVLLSLQHEIVVTHELGHNWGAEHDPTDIPSCNPQSDGKYIMWPFAVPGYEENNKYFSICSKRLVAPVLRSKSRYCFRNFDDKKENVLDPIKDVLDPSKDEADVRSLCGNGIIEEGEQCDVGFIEQGQQDKCCSVNCKLKQGAVCSDFNMPCCKDCQVAASSVKCEERNPLACKGEAYCNGISLECPVPAKLPDNTSCIDLGKCFGGECLNFCQLKGLVEGKKLKPCHCTQNTTAMCHRCCVEVLENGQKGECLPTTTRQVDGRTCLIGACSNGVCEKLVQELSSRIFKFIKELTVSQLVEFMKSNIVGTVIVLSLVIWIPASWIVSCVDKRKIVQRDLDFQRWASREHSLMGGPGNNLKEFNIKNSRFRTIPETTHRPANREDLHQRQQN